MRSHYPGQQRDTERYLDLAGPEVSGNIVHCHFLRLQLNRDAQWMPHLPENTVLAFSTYIHFKADVQHHLWC